MIQSMPQRVDQGHPIACGHLERSAIGFLWALFNMLREEK